ncbi:MAG TPA: hypothetical protein VFY98_12575 [Intrasporangium sp.]|nr:hypothetical protein [Intrasporangium sp.]
MNQTDTTTEPGIVEPSTTDWIPVHVTRSLLGWGVIAGPCLVFTWIAAVARHHYRALGALA